MGSKNQSFSVIQATRSHLSQIYELENRIFSRGPEIFSRARLRSLLSSPNATFFLLWDHEYPVGYGIALKNKLRNGLDKGRIYLIGVIWEHRSKGAGSLLLGAMEEFLMKSGVAFIVSETLNNEDGAESFFIKHGYGEPQLLPNYYPYCYPHGDAVRLRKVISKR